MPHAALLPVELELVPGRGLGAFELGDSLWHVLDYLRMNKTSFPKMEIQWDHENAISSPVIVDTDHIRLVFPPTPIPSAQLLQKIVIKDVSKATTESPGVKLLYKGRTLASRSIGSAEGACLDRRAVAQVFGPTIDRPGCSHLIYPGVAFGFEQGGTSKDLPGQGRSQAAADVIIFAASGVVDEAGKGKDRDRERLDADPAEESIMQPTEAMEGNVRQCDIMPCRGVTLHFHSVGHPIDPLEVIIDETTTQDLLCELGPPLRRYWQEDSRIADVWEKSSAANDLQADGHDVSLGAGCWWNYFQFGLDFLIDDEGDGLVKKIMVHSNIPGSALFQRHARCPWTLDAPGGTRCGIGTPLKTIASVLGSKTSPVDQALQVMSHDRTGEGSLVDVEGIGPSKLLALPGLVVEEADGGGITAVLICPV